MPCPQGHEQNSLYQIAYHSPVIMPVRAINKRSELNKSFTWIPYCQVLLYFHKAAGTAKARVISQGAAQAAYQHSNAGLRQRLSVPAAQAAEQTSRRQLLTLRRAQPTGSR